MGEQSWSDDPVDAGRILVVTGNPVSRALVALGGTVGRSVEVVSDEAAIDRLGWADLEARDAVVLADHDHPQITQLLRTALTSPAGYVAMLASRARARVTFEEISAELPAEAVSKLRVPAGLDIGGKHPGEMALSVLAEIVADSNGREGGPMRGAIPSLDRLIPTSSPTGRLSSSLPVPVVEGEPTNQQLIDAGREERL